MITTVDVEGNYSTKVLATEESGDDWKRLYATVIVERDGAWSVAFNAEWRVRGLGGIHVTRQLSSAIREYNAIKVR